MTSQRPTGFRISSGLLHQKHIESIGPALPELLCLIDWQTARSGRVRGGAPVRINEIAERLGRSRRTVERNLRRLSPYLETTRTPYGFVIRILNQKKWPKYDTNDVSPTERYDKSGGSEGAEIRHRCPSDTTHMSETKKTRKQEVNIPASRGWVLLPKRRSTVRHAATLPTVRTILGTCAVLSRKPPV